ncbi:probable magnesium transporter NIPA3 [Macadamia integrifolia]|uniref:probable magnesium transporter NIPA3 n=1 Tax=Macadamia integrifolia TaxID=60698 RepID=UPI001C52C1CD|nr:probable magnesium transporter NIPA3 [Macadamia integrifolia]
MNRKKEKKKGRTLEMGFSKDNLIGFVLAISSSAFIGASFIIKKKGLKRAAAASGVRAGVGGYSYLLEPLWWVGMITREAFEVAAEGILIGLAETKRA